MKQCDHLLILSDICSIENSTTTRIAPNRPHISTKAQQSPFGHSHEFTSIRLICILFHQDPSVNKWQKWTRMLKNVLSWWCWRRWEKNPESFVIQTRIKSACGQFWPQAHPPSKFGGNPFISLLVQQTYQPANQLYSKPASNQHTKHSKTTIQQTNQPANQPTNHSNQQTNKPNNQTANQPHSKPNYTYVFVCFTHHPTF